MLQRLLVEGRREERAAGGKGWFPILYGPRINTAAAQQSAGRILLSAKVFE